VDALIGMALNVPIFALVLCRGSGIMLAAPIFSSTAIPAQIRVALAVLLALIMYQFASQYAGALPSAVLGYVPLVLNEMGLGLVMGFAAGMLLAAMQAAGGLAAQQIGLGLGEIASPDQDEETDEMSTLFQVIGMLLFLAIDGHHWLIQALAVSYREVPIGHAHWSPAVNDTIQSGFCGLFITALRAAAPLMGIMFLVNVIVALMAKAVPQMNILLVGYPVKVFAGVVALALTFPLTLPVMRDAFQRLNSDLLVLSRAF